MTIADIAELHKSIEMARYALAHIAAKLECADVDIADKALTKAAHIMNKILGEVSRQKKRRRRWILKWTSEPPTKEGWYFMRQGGQMTVCRVVLYCDGLVAMFGAMRQSVDFMKKISTEWAGPIPEPVEPEE